ncbi:MAG: hypothetical protein PHN42_05250 [Bacilli bacterium]|nr:hypothetical protein [Bacilli bacterium]
MYNDNSNNAGFSIKNLILQFLFVALFIFIILWLFPLKSDLNSAVNTLMGDETETTDSFYNRVFYENVIAMRDGAKSYLTTSRLPKNIGDKVKLTLQDMLDKHIILPFVDKNGDTCDVNASYVEVTKYEDEYVMKVNLKCGEEENYLLVYMGCYDYCTTTLCEKNASDVKKPVLYSGKTNQPVTSVTVVNNNTNINNNNNNNTVTPTPTPDVKKYLYEYVKTTDGYYVESDWSSWSTTAVSASSTTAVKTKTVTEQVLTGYNVTTSTDTTKPIYGTKIVNTGAENLLVCNNYAYVADGSATIAGNEWTYVGYVTLYSVPTSTDTVKYEYVKAVDESCNETCGSTVGRIYKKYVKTSSTVDMTKYTCTSSSIKTVQLYTTVTTIIGYQTTTSKTPVYETRVVKYYSYKTRTYVEGAKDTRWSIYNDTTLLSSGYQYTGNKKEV